MAKHNELGKAGENAAVTYLEQQGYIIRDRNWRKGHFELDIVATKEQELIVVEVKTRSNTQFAEPEDAVDIPKINRTVRLILGKSTASSGSANRVLLRVFTSITISSLSFAATMSSSKCPFLQFRLRMRYPFCSR